MHALLASHPKACTDRTGAFLFCLECQVERGERGKLLYWPFPPHFEEAETLRGMATGTEEATHSTKATE